MKKIFCCFLFLFFTNTGWAFKLDSPSFKNGEPLPAAYTCDGKDISPALNWSDAPKNTASYAFILSDMDAPGGIFYHWVIYNLPPQITSLPEGMKTLSNGATYGINSWNKARYNGPCPPKGSNHRYVFTIYALDNTILMAKGADAAHVLTAMNNHVLAKAERTATYSH